MSKNLARQTNAVILLASIYSGNPQYRFDLILNSSRPITGSEKTKSAKKKCWLRFSSFGWNYANILLQFAKVVNWLRVVTLTLVVVEAGKMTSPLWKTEAIQSLNSGQTRDKFGENLIKGQTGCRPRAVRCLLSSKQALFACFHATFSEVVYCSLKITQSTLLTSHFGFSNAVLPLSCTKLSLNAPHPQFSQ